MKPIERISKFEVLPFEYLTFTPATDNIRDVYSRATLMRDEAQKFFSKNWNSVNEGSTLEETMKSRFDPEALKAENERIYKSLEFLFQPIRSNGERSEREVVISNSRPIGRENGLSACDAIVGQRTGGVEIKTVVYRSKKGEWEARIG
ncbi:MAG: hypothetical protein FJX34_00845 [Alphaproteobacteria bacterium]|nr:hypothetical protein [Alphaproteobacteria bacterium]